MDNCDTSYKAANIINFTLILNYLELFVHTFFQFAFMCAK